MSDKLFKWEIALAFGLLTALLWGVTTSRAQEELAEQVIRIHVVAHSDSEKDQRLKLCVWDAVLEVVGELGGEANDPEELAHLLKLRLPELEQVGEQVLREYGCFLDVTAQIDSYWFPTKDYEDFSFPAGEYTALRLVVGDGEGENWWCVAFPPLCLGAAAQSIEQAVEVGYFTQEQANLITAQEGEYVLRFKCMELLGAMKGMFLRGSR